MDYKSILTDLGYKLEDRGNYWQAAAVFREGDNKTALKIYKDSGVWVDFVEGEKALPFEVLLKKTVGKDDISNIMKGGETIFRRKEQKLLKEERSFSPECLIKLLPDFDYFEERGIPKEVQKVFNCGLSTQRKFYNRIVFPVFRKDGRIHGFTGRTVANNDAVKWLHYGKTRDWFYPYFSVEGVPEAIQSEERIFLVESVGDCLALYREGIKNTCVAFTNNLSAQLVSKLAALNIPIFLAFNNDKSSDCNRGFDGAIRAILKLRDVMDLNKVWFTPPPRDDFGELTSKEIQEWYKNIPTDNAEAWKPLLEYLPKANLPRTVKEKAKVIEKDWRFMYG